MKIGCSANKRFTIDHQQEDQTELDCEGTLQLAHGTGTHRYPRSSFIMNLPAAIGAYRIFATKPEVNFDFEVAPSDGQLVIWQ